MRESERQAKAEATKRAADTQAESCDERTYFESYYKASVQGEPTERMTIGQITEMESRFHYNCVENSIIVALARISPPPPSLMAQGWRMLQERRQLRLLDIGTGTGHWIEFMRDTFHVASAFGTEITTSMREFLENKYAQDDAVTIMDLDLAEPDFRVNAIGGPVDYITAIGVMFHIIRDDRWRQAVANLAAALKPDGYAIIGGEFGDVTEDRETVKTDQFESWKDYAQADAPSAEKVTKRVRSLADWEAAAAACGLHVVELVRSQCDEALTTPENDVLVLGHAKSA